MRTVTQGARKLDTYPRAASRLRISFLIFHCSTAISSFSEIFDIFDDFGVKFVVMGLVTRGLFFRIGKLSRPSWVTKLGEQNELIGYLGLFT